MKAKKFSGSSLIATFNVKHYSAVLSAAYRPSWKMSLGYVRLNNVVSVSIGKMDVTISWHDMSEEVEMSSGGTRFGGPKPN